MRNRKPLPGRTDAASRLVREEDGGLMGNLIFLVIVIAVIALLVVDSLSVVSAYQLVDETTTEAAQKARFEYESYKDDVRAENAAADTCEAKDLVFEEFEIRYDFGRTYKIPCSREAQTLVFKYIPYLRDLTYQQKTVFTSDL